jgi:hypothetical protein
MLAEQISERVQPVSQMLAEDGYRLRVELHDDGVISATVEATPDACAECLVPSEVMEGVLRSHLGEDALHEGRHELTVAYPKDSDHSGRTH